MTWSQTARVVCFPFFISVLHLCSSHQPKGNGSRSECHDKDGERRSMLVGEKIIAFAMLPIPPIRSSTNHRGVSCIKATAFNRVVRSEDHIHAP